MLYIFQKMHRMSHRLQAIEAEVGNYWSDMQSRREKYLMTGMFPFTVQYVNPESAFTQLNSVIDKIINDDLRQSRV